jgi:protein gp37
MGANTGIEWTDASWTPIRAHRHTTGKRGWHCVHASEGCRHCYAEAINLRLGTGLPFKPGHLAGDIELFLDEGLLAEPLRWKRPRMVFVCSMTDLFADFVPDAWIDRIFAVMQRRKQHTFQVLTKRAKRMCRYMTDRQTPVRVGLTRVEQETPQACLVGVNEAHERAQWPLPNVWAGVSCERQEEADERIPDLLATPAAVRFISAEPLLGPIRFRPYTLTERPCVVCETADRLNEARARYSHPINCGWRQDGERAGTYRQKEPDGRGIDWVIVGGESGPNARPMHPDWARALRDHCTAAGVAFFFKQWGEWAAADVHDGVYFSAATGEVGLDGGRWGRNRIINWDDAAFTDIGKKAAGRLLDGREWNEMPRTESDPQGLTPAHQSPEGTSAP